MLPTFVWSLMFMDYNCFIITSFSSLKFLCFRKVFYKNDGQKIKERDSIIIFTLLKMAQRYSECRIDSREKIDACAAAVVKCVFIIVIISKSLGNELR